MGIYVNPGNAAFKEAVNSLVYVDKSGLINYTNSVLNTMGKNLCVSRPRRFGKSMAANMLVAYYSKGCDSGNLFSGLKVGGESMEIFAEGRGAVASEGGKVSGEEGCGGKKRRSAYRENLNQHNVIRFDVQKFLLNAAQLDILVDRIQREIIRELKIEFGEYYDVEREQYGLTSVLEEIYASTGTGFIFIVDEWDCVFRLAKENTKVQKEYLDFLRVLFKESEYVDLAYMTGILPIKKYGDHSALDIFDEYSMTAPKSLEVYFGFTEEEVLEQCRRHGVDYDEMQKWYDGYLVGGTHIYNPKSVVDALRWKKFGSYWTGTETYEALKIYVEQNFQGLKEAIVEMLGNGRCKINPQKFQNDMTTFKSRDDVLTLLVHLGYLTYDEVHKETFIPNLEIIQEFFNAVEEPGWDGLMQALKSSMELLESTWAMDGDAVAKGMDVIHSETTSILKYNNENALACVIYMAYYSASAYYARPLAELPTGKGYADIVYLPLRNVERPALVVELKWDQSASGAIAQIKNKRYGEWIESYTGNILLVGVNYDRGTKEHRCIIEKWLKE